MKTLTIVFLLSLITSCATSYKKSGWGGGYNDSQVSTDMYEVEFNGNGYTSEGTVLNYLKRRCAELTIEKGYTHYSIIKERDTNDSYLYTNTMNGNISSVNKHGKRVTIKLLRNHPENDFAYDAYIILGKDRGISSILDN